MSRLYRVWLRGASGEPFELRADEVERDERGVSFITYAGTAADARAGTVQDVFTSAFVPFEQIILILHVDDVLENTKESTQ